MTTEAYDLCGLLAQVQRSDSVEDGQQCHGYQVVICPVGATLDTARLTWRSDGSVVVTLDTSERGQA